MPAWLQELRKAQNKKKKKLRMIKHYEGLFLIKYILGITEYFK